MTRYRSDPRQGGLFDRPGLDEAFARGQEGMETAGEHADDVHEGWREHAYEFLLTYASKHPLFISEDVSDASKEAGFPQPPTDRAWGSVYLRAQRARVIAKAGIGRSRRRHASICPLWQSRVVEVV